MEVIGNIPIGVAILIFLYGVATYERDNDTHTG